MFVYPVLSNALNLNAETSHTTLTYYIKEIESYKTFRKDWNHSFFGMLFIQLKNL